MTLLPGGLMLPALATATVYVVDTTDDNISEDGNVSLREAIVSANTNMAVNADVTGGDVTGDLILFDSTVFSSATITLANLPGFGDLEITDDVEIDGLTGSGSGATDVTIDGSALNRIFHIDSASNGLVEIIGVTLQNGDGTDSDSDASDGKGGAVYIESGDVKLDTLTASSNDAEQGGVIFNDGGTLTIASGSYSANTAREGGAFYNNSGTTVFEDNGLINSNQGTGSPGNGGAIFVAGGALTLIDTFTISANSALGSGGTIYISGGSLLGTSVSIQSGAANGQAFTQGGGNVFVEGGSVSLTSSTITGGDADGDEGCGGGMHVANGTVELTGGTITSNNANGDRANGAGLCVRGGSVTLSNVTVSSNNSDGLFADTGGGGIFMDAGELSISNGSISSNNANASGGSGSGGGLFIAGGSATINGTSISSNNGRRAGGGIEVRSVDNEVDLVLIDVSLNSNGASNNPGNGAGLHVTAPVNAEEARVSLFAGTVQSNSAASEGGGLWNDVEGIMTVQGTNINNNSAAGNNADNGGGGIFNNGGTVTLTGAIVNSNNANGTSGSGGGILNDGGTLTVSGSIISNNIAVRAGGGIEITTANSRDSDVTISAASISNNTAGSGPGNGGGLHVTDAVGGNTSTVTISDNTSIISNLAIEEGGGLWNDAGGTMSISNSSIQANHANSDNDATDAQGGGGIFNNGGILTIESTNIRFNTVSATSAADNDDGGGGIFNDGTGNPGTITISSNSIISDNSADGTSHNGGGILNVGGGNTGTAVSVTDSRIASNSTARAGGGIENNAGTVTILRSTLDSNEASVNGGAIHQSGDATISITESTINGNIASNEGGGLWQSSNANASANVFRSTFSQNTAAVGGALFNDGADGDIGLQNVTVSANLASGAGGGLQSEGGDVTVINSTFSLNQSDSDMNASGSGGGVNLSAGAGLTLLNTILADNIDNTGTGNDIVSAAAVTATNSVIEDAAGGHGVSNGTNGNIVGEDPMLAALADNGGPVLTHLIQTGSNAIDAGTNTNCPSTDARNLPRPQDGLLDGMAFCDIGAVEIGFDCNSNGTFDTTDVVNNTSEDCDGNLLPDECQNDADNDGTIDSCEDCDSDPAKLVPGVCGCGVADTDTDSDGTADCQDNCPMDPGKTDAGTCGCGVSDVDTDADGALDCQDACINDPNKTAVGQCGCGIADTDTDSNGEPDCLITSDFDTQLNETNSLVDALVRGSNRGDRRKLIRSLRSLLRFAKQNRQLLAANAEVNVLRRVKRYNRLVRRTLRSGKKRFDRNKQRASNFFTANLAPLFESIAG